MNSPIDSSSTAPAAVVRLHSLARHRRGRPPMPLTPELMRNLGMLGLSMAQAGALVGLSRGQMSKRFSAEPALRAAFVGGYRDLRAAAISALETRLLSYPGDTAVLNLLTHGRGFRLTADERARLDAARASGN